MLLLSYTGREGDKELDGEGDDDNAGAGEKAGEEEGAVEEAGVGVVEDGGGGHVEIFDDAFEGREEKFMTTGGEECHVRK